jgi:galactokinase
LSEPVSSSSASRAFENRFGYKPSGVWSAPGRVNLIGEHTDYNEGFVLPFAINRRTYAAIATRKDQIARIASGFNGEVIEFDISKIEKGAVQGWSSYPLGVAWALMQAGAAGTGFDLFVDSDVPVGAGLSSSAAIECSVAMGLNQLWGAGLDESSLARVGQKAENEIVGAPTGIMDQTASLFGVADSAVFLDCRSYEAILIPLNLKSNSLEIVVMNTTVAHRLVDGGYAERRAACELGAKTMGAKSLRDLTEADLTRASQLLDDTNFRRVKHVVTENQRVLETVQLLKTKGPRAIGELLLASHDSMRDDFEISIEELDVAVEVAAEVGAIGARMTGGGFGGAAIALIESQKVPELKAAVVKEFAVRGFATPELFSVIADQGARFEG